MSFQVINSLLQFISVLNNFLLSIFSLNSKLIHFFNYFLHILYNVVVGPFLLLCVLIDNGNKHFTIV